jgi:hypothetical protein
MSDNLLTPPFSLQLLCKAAITHQIIRVSYCGNRFTNPCTSCRFHLNMGSFNGMNMLEISDAHNSSGQRVIDWVKKCKPMDIPPIISKQLVCAINIHLTNGLISRAIRDKFDLHHSQHCRCMWLSAIYGKRTMCEHMCICGNYHLTLSWNHNYEPQCSNKICNLPETQVSNGWEIWEWI